MTQVSADPTSGEDSSKIVDLWEINLEVRMNENDLGPVAQKWLVGFLKRTD